MEPAIVMPLRLLSHRFVQRWRRCHWAWMYYLFSSHFSIPVGGFILYGSEILDLPCLRYVTQHLICVVGALMTSISYLILPTSQHHFLEWNALSRYIHPYIFPVFRYHFRSMSEVRFIFLTFFMMKSMRSSAIGPSCHSDPSPEV